MESFDVIIVGGGHAGTEAAAAAARLVEPDEAFEHPLALGRRDAGPRVLDLDDGVHRRRRTGAAAQGHGATGTTSGARWRVGWRTTGQAARRAMAWPRC